MNEAAVDFANNDRSEKLYELPFYLCGTSVRRHISKIEL